VPVWDPKRKPDYQDVRYGPFERNVLDICQAKSDKPTPLILYIHGGVFTSGDKLKLNATLLDLCNKADITIAAMNYRYAT
jgi:acetyl esterase/lipase